MSNTNSNTNSDDDYDLTMLLSDKAKNKLEKETKLSNKSKKKKTPRSETPYSETPCSETQSIYILTQDEINLLKNHPTHIFCYCCFSDIITEIIQREFECEGCFCCRMDEFL